MTTNLSELHRKLVYVARQVRLHVTRYGSSQKLSTPAINVLFLLREKPATLPFLARAMATSRQNMRGLAQTLAERGMVLFEANPAHKRSELVRLTDAGLRFLDRLNAVGSRDNGSDPRLLAKSQEMMSVADELLNFLGQSNAQGVGRVSPGDKTEGSRKRNQTKAVQTPQSARVKADGKEAQGPLPILSGTDNWQDEEMPVNLL